MHLAKLDEIWTSGLFYGNLIRGNSTSLKMRD